MKIIILGSGKIGRIIAKAFSNDLHELIIIDSNKDNLELINETLDVLTINDNESNLSVLHAAGAIDAEMLIAASEHDEVNLLACHYAKHVFNIPTRIVRIRNQDNYKWRETIFDKKLIDANLVLFPERIMVDHIYDLIRFHGVTGYNELADSNFVIYEIKSQYGGTAIGKIFKEFGNHFKKLGVFIVSVKRNGVKLKAYKNTTIEAGDEVLILCPKDSVLPSVSLFIRPEIKPKRIMISGSGQLAFVLAQRLAKEHFEFKIFEPDPGRANKISDLVDHAKVIQAPISNQEVLFNEGIEVCDLFISINPNTEDNIVNCLLAKKMGAKKVIALLENISYRNILNIKDIDIAISMSTPVSTLVKSHSLFSTIKKIITIDAESEVYEFKIAGDENTSKLVGKTLEDCIKELPTNCQFAGLIRNSTIMGYDLQMTIKPNDNFLVYITNSRALSGLIKLFSLSEDYF